MMTRRTTAVVVMMLAVFAACGPSARERAIRATFITTNAARDGFNEYGKQRQDQIIEQATSLEDGKARLAAFRDRREKINKVFEDVYRAIVAATLANDTGSLDAALKATERLKDAIDDLKKLEKSP
ncbi:MAG: hypothetical protein ACREJC_17730 [Tepidisphaeraceae bacterium]